MFECSWLNIFSEVYDVYEWPFELDQKMIFTTVARLNENFDLKAQLSSKNGVCFLNSSQLDPPKPRLSQQAEKRNLSILHKI